MYRKGLQGFIEYRPYFENYTVDASIFVVKLLSAHGGCLGIRSFLSETVKGLQGFIEYRPYFENYTVDASIFVVKLLSAHGGCLGIRSR
jgi:hypothetical protein